MKPFYLKEMYLLSLKERKARKVAFDRRRTVIIGKNSTGKSCLVKSIYQTFGAEPHNVHPNWKAAEVISLVCFTVASRDYFIIRAGKAYGVFDAQGALINRFVSVSELAKLLAELFDFKIQLMNREKHLVTPPPAYLFLPYYIDQDQSWTSNWASFDRLYLPAAKSDIANYHLGIKTNAYYETKGQIRVVEEGIKTIDGEAKIIRSLLRNLKEKLAEVSFSLSLDDFQQELKQLLAQYEEVSAAQSLLKHDLSHLYSAKISLSAQLDITKKALNEAHGDYKFALNTLEDEVECPSCGAKYENSFAERFGMAQDEQRCLDLIIDLNGELVALEAKIVVANSVFSEYTKSLANIEKQLETKKGEIKLKDLIENEGKKEMKSLFESELARLESQLKDKLLEKKNHETSLKQINDKERSKEIKSKYLLYMRKNLAAVNVTTLSEANYSRIDSSIRESGSAMPRALMAYYYSVLQLANEYTSSVFCPIVIDAPNQQGQDSDNMPSLLNFITKHQPADSQLILTIEEQHGIDFDGKLIELTNKMALLKEDEYSDVLEKIKPFLVKLG